MSKIKKMNELFEGLEKITYGDISAILSGLLDPLLAKSPREASDFLSYNIKILSSRLETMKKLLNLDERQTLEYMNNRSNFSHDEWEQLEKFRFDIDRFSYIVSEKLSNELNSENALQRKNVSKVRNGKHSKRDGWIRA